MISTAINRTIGIERTRRGTEESERNETNGWNRTDGIERTVFVAPPFPGKPSGKTAPRKNDLWALGKMFFKHFLKMGS